MTSITQSEIDNKVDYSLRFVLLTTLNKELFNIYIMHILIYINDMRIHIYIYIYMFRSEFNTFIFFW